MTWRSRPPAGARSGILRASSLLLAATAILAAFMAAPSAAVAAPAPSGDAAVAAIGAERTSASSAGTLSVTTSTAAAASPAKGGGFSVMSGSCPYAGQYIDPWLIVFQGCTLTGQPTTAVSARCSNGATLGPVQVPPGVYDIYVDCYPAFFSSLAFI
ncbi:hypothetical protein ACGFH8_17420 [Micromonospora sp. NPDC049175]|uniref:hypothetical protein n=1 Tax=Micromonospora sp. NPDC049175 TaxID=3364266 RepID=UPI0037113FB6